MDAISSHDDIPGTIIFDGRQAMKGYALNKMCFSFNKAVNRAAFKEDQDAYCDRYGIPFAFEAKLSPRA